MKRKQAVAALAAFTMVFVETTGVLQETLVPDSGTMLTVKAEEYHGLEYEILDDGTIIITGCDKTLTSLEIPAVIDGKAVTWIGNSAFCDCHALTDISIPDGVTYIGGSAFADCTNLTSITIPDSVTCIGQMAFHNTAWYHSQPDGTVYIGKFLYCYKGEMPENTHIIVKDGTTSFGLYAFCNCTGLTSITIPDSMTSIASEAFTNCTGLTNVTLPDSVTSIEQYAFGGCTGLTDITILNPDCQIPRYTSPIPETTIIHGYENSTAQTYAEWHDQTFISLGEAPAVQPLYGDANDDGEVTIVDVVKLCRCAMGADTLTKAGEVNADVDGNGIADATDASYIIQSLVGLVTLPIVTGV